MQGFVAAAAPASGFVSTVDTYERHFDRLNERQTVDLGEDYIAVPIWCIRRRNNTYTDEERARAGLLEFNWTPKHSPDSAFPQRCPSVWVDNLLFLYREGMPEPALVLGRWAKKGVSIYGTKRDVEGLVIAAGGHKERMAKKPARYEEGDMSLREAADKEIKEEVGVDPRNIRVTKEFGLMDDVFGDPRCDGMRAMMYLRWIEQNPKPTEELKNIIAVPVSQLGKLARNEVKWRFSDGKEMGLILGHDKVLRLLMRHPTVNDFLALIRTYHENHTGAAMEVGGAWKPPACAPGSAPGTF
jgi:ADP-ribose pyrophosphatase YjhB (NUDIX family)